MRRSRAGAFDCVRFFESGTKPFGVEWETGNISSSHRAMNRIGVNILDGFTSGGILVVPSWELYPYLTDRIGNERELLPYHSLWERWDDLSRSPYYLGIVAVEHDNLDSSLPLIPKGRDGRSPLSAFRGE